MAEPLPKDHRCNRCGEWYHNAHICGTSLQNTTLKPPMNTTTRNSAEAPWRCFHCDEVFTDRDGAREHFGGSEYQQPACHIDIAEYRKMEEVNRRHCEEDTDLHRQIHGLNADHQTALRREEEKGYARGLKDGAALAVPQGGVPSAMERFNEWAPEHRRLQEEALRATPASTTSEPAQTLEDAARYRWLREFPNNFTATLYSAHALKRDEYLDAAIDALRLSPPADEQGGAG